jgi:hypothetical protein
MTSNIAQGSMDDKKRELKNVGRKQKKTPLDLRFHCMMISWKPCSTQSKWRLMTPDAINR